MRYAVWTAFLLGIAVSLAANIAAAPSLGWQQILVAGWPPVALLLSVELLAHRPDRRERSETGSGARAEGLGNRETHQGLANSALASDEKVSRSTAEQIMWSHFQQARAQGRMPTGAELDRAAGTNNYGRAVLARWRQKGLVEHGDEQASRRP